MSNERIYSRMFTVYKSLDSCTSGRSTYCGAVVCSITHHKVRVNSVILYLCVAIKSHAVTACLEEDKFLSPRQPTNLLNFKPVLRAFA